MSSWFVDIVSMLLPWLGLAALPVFALALTCSNLLVWPRGRPGGGRRGASVSVLVPARDEEETIERCVRAAFDAGHDVEEVVVCDDGSEDETPAILARLGEEFEDLRVIEGAPLPDSWIGKPHACHQLAAAARGDVLVYVDADTFLCRRGLARILSIFDDYDAELVTAVPRQRTESFFERLILPLLHLTYTSWLPLPLIWHTSDPRFLAANGQVLAIERECYERIGGFEKVRREVVDDMAICREVKRAGGRVVFADGYSIAECRMYDSAREVWEGFSKNLYEGIGGHWMALLGVVSIYFVAFVLPFVALPVAAWLGASWWPAAALGVGANVLLRGVLTVRMGHPPEGIILQPVAVLGLLAIAWNSFLWNRRGEILWSGRVYTERSSR
jgi:chlorobactene glucosyltransferase